jgi:molecular chaperone HscB
MLKRQGLELADSKQMPPELLSQVFELNEALEEARNGGEKARPQLEAEGRRFLSLLGDADATLDRLCLRYDEGDGAALSEICAVLTRRRYIANLLAQTERSLKGFEKIM